MSKVHNYSLSLVAAFGALSMHGQSQDDGLAMNTKTPTATEFNKTTIAPIKEGGYSDALQLSADEKMLVLYIRGGEGLPGASEGFTAEQYAKAFVAGFKNPEYSKCPTDIAVRFIETGKAQRTVVVPMSNGQEYRNPDGRLSFTPYEVKEALNDITAKHNENNGISTPKIEMGGNSVAANDLNKS